MRADRHSDRLDCRAFVLDALVQEQAKRGRDLAWIDKERMAVTVAANQWATAHGYGPVLVCDVERVESLAMGHVDYSQKLALYVAELVVRAER